MQGSREASPFEQNEDRPASKEASPFEQDVDMGYDSIERMGQKEVSPFEQEEDMQGSKEASPFEQDEDMPGSKESSPFEQNEEIAATKEASLFKQNEEMEQIPTETSSFEQDEQQAPVSKETSPFEQEQNIENVEQSSEDEMDDEILQEHDTIEEAKLDHSRETGGFEPFSVPTEHDSFNAMNRSLVMDDGQTIEQFQDRGEEDMVPESSFEQNDQDDLVMEHEKDVHNVEDIPKHQDSFEPPDIGNNLQWQDMPKETSNLLDSQQQDTENTDKQQDLFDPFQQIDGEQNTEFSESKEVTPPAMSDSETKLEEYSNNRFDEDVLGSSVDQPSHQQEPAIGKDEIVESQTTQLQSIPHETEMPLHKSAEPDVFKTDTSELISPQEDMLKEPEIDLEKEKELPECIDKEEAKSTKNVSKTEVSSKKTSKMDVTSKKAPKTEVSKQKPKESLLSSPKKKATKTATNTSIQAKKNAKEPSPAKDSSKIPSPTKTTASKLPGQTKSRTASTPRSFTRTSALNKTPNQGSPANSSTTQNWNDDNHIEKNPKKSRTGLISRPKSIPRIMSPCTPPGSNSGAASPEKPQRPKQLGKESTSSFLERMSRPTRRTPKKGFILITICILY